MSCCPDQLHLFLPVGPQTCCWLWAVGWGEKSQPGENNQNPNWIKQNKILHRRRGCVFPPSQTFHGAICLPPSAGGILTPCLRSPTAQKGIRNDKSQRKERSRVSSSLFIEEKKRRRKKIDYFVCFFFFFLSVCFRVDVIHVVSLSQCPKATSLFTNVSRYSGQICLSLFPLSAFQGGAAWNKSESESKDK